MLLYELLGQKCRTVTCAPTNIAVLEVAARLMSLVTQSTGYDTYGLGDVVLFGNRKRMKIDDHSDLLNIFLDYRAKILSKCFAPTSGWRNCLSSLIGLVEDPEEQYRLYLINEKNEESDEDDGYDDEEEVELSCVPDIRSLKYTREKNVWRELIVQILRKNDKKINWRCKYPSQKDRQLAFGRKKRDEYSENRKKMNFEDFFRNRFDSKREFMKFCIVNLVTHLPTSFISQDEVKNMMAALRLLESFKTSLYSDAVNGIGLKEVLAQIMNVGQVVNVFSMLKRTRKEVLNILKSLVVGICIPNFFDEYSIKMFCLQNACLFFCTASSSSRLHVTSMELLVVDEAAQLKECESTIPLQLPGLRHAILVGDERQLPALVRSKVHVLSQFLFILLQLFPQVLVNKIHYVLVRSLMKRGLEEVYLQGWYHWDTKKTSLTFNIECIHQLAYFPIKSSTINRLQMVRMCGKRTIKSISLKEICMDLTLLLT